MDIIRFLNQIWLLAFLAVEKVNGVPTCKSIALEEKGQRLHSHWLDAVKTADCSQPEGMVGIPAFRQIAALRAEFVPGKLPRTDCSKDEENWSNENGIDFGSKLGNRSLCSYHWINTNDTMRYPEIIIEAKCSTCQCRQPNGEPGTFLSGSAFECAEIKRPFTVLYENVQATDEECPYEVKYMDISIGCTCMLYPTGK